MILIVVLLTIVFLIFGYYLMDRIDKFIAYNNLSLNEDFSNEEKESTEDEYVILIYGENDLVKGIKDYCDSKKYTYQSISDISNIKSNYKYSCLLALSNNDADNLMVGRVGLKLYSIPKIVGLCNREDNLKIYKEFNFNRALLQNSGIDKVFINIKELLEKEINPDGIS